MFSFTNYFLFITLNALLFADSNEIAGGTCIMPNISTETAQQMVVEYVKKRKNTERIDVSVVEQKNGVWIIRGTCPIDLEGHPWAERFEVVIDEKGKIRYTEFSLL